MLESLLITILRDILCGTLSLDDGLSNIQNAVIAGTEESDISFEIARAIEEIILRRPGLANAKLTELTVRLSFRKNRILPEMLALLDTRYTTSSWRAECELLPDKKAIPQLLDIMGELIHSMDTAIRLNLRPLLPFLTDEVLNTLEAVLSRYHQGSISLALHEAHYLAGELIDAGFFAGAELLLNRLLEATKEMDMQEMNFHIALDEASVLTQLGLFKQSRDILKDLEKRAKNAKDPMSQAEVVLALSINETRDDSVPHEKARVLGDKAAKLFQDILNEQKHNRDKLGLAQLVLGLNILANGWREAIPQSIERLELGLRIFESIEEPTLTQSLLHLKCLSGLGFAYGNLGDHESLQMSIEYLENAKELLKSLEQEGHDVRVEHARCDNALGWVSLSSESDEYWPVGVSSFQDALDLRTELHAAGDVSEIEVLGTRTGLALSLVRDPETANEGLVALRNVLTQYTPLFPTDPRAFIEVAIATYNIVWMTQRHGETVTDNLIRLLDDIDKMLAEAREQIDSIFITGATLVVPYLRGSWAVLRERAMTTAGRSNQLKNVAIILASLASSKINLDTISLEAGVRSLSAINEEVNEIDELLGMYWNGQLSLAQTLKDYFRNKDYSQLSTGLYRTAAVLQSVKSIHSSYEASTEFIIATSVSLSNILLRFARALESQYDALIDRTGVDDGPELIGLEQYSFILAEDWLNLLKITDSYLGMIEHAEITQARPYLNAIFSNITSALRMMDSVSLTDRRVLNLLGEEMNRRYYLRS